jgi:starch phosphorylase
MTDPMQPDRHAKANTADAPERRQRARRDLMDMPRLGMDADSLARAFQANFTLALGRDSGASLHYHRNALALTLRDRLVERWRDTSMTYATTGVRRLHYLSLEYLIGRSLGNAALNLGVSDALTEALYQFGLDAEQVADSEADAGLGNGGLGRLAACFLDSCATLQLPVRGYGLRYQYGMFRQQIENGWQVEEPDRWLRDGNPWEFERPEFTRRVRFGGHTWSGRDRDGRLRFGWRDTQDVLAVPYDMPIPGYRNGTVNSLRLWSAAPTDEFDLGEFNEGSYTESVRAKNDAENITMVLYPNDTTENGKELRLRQQYFLASATLQDVIADWKQYRGSDFSEFAQKNCFQLNDTHPTIAVAELMRLLMDDEQLEWDDAWRITSQTMAYTNHTLLPEALERWPVALFRQLLPRLLEIIYEINARFLAEVSNRWPGDLERLRRMSIIDEDHGQQVRMAHLAIVGSFSINGVAELHSRLLAEQLFRDFYELWPSKFNNKTNGVTQRRWLAHCNPALSGLIGSAIGDGWIREMEQLGGLRPFAEDAGFRQEWRAVRQQNKARLAAMVEHECGVQFDPSHLFDVQVKRIHEYKRQLLNVLHVIHLYDRAKRGDFTNWAPRCVLFGGKAAPGYQRAKLIVKLIGNVAAVINQDPSLRGLLSVAFLPNYRPVGTDLHRRERGVGHRQHEIHDERRAHHRHPRRRQYRDPRRRRRRALLPVRPHRRGGGGDPTVLPAAALRRGRSRLRAGDGAAAQRALQPVRAGTVPAHRRFHPEPRRPVDGGRRLHRLRQCAGARGRALPRHRRLEPQQHPQHGRERLVLHRPHHPRVQRRHLESVAHYAAARQPPLRRHQRRAAASGEHRLSL